MLAQGLPSPWLAQRIPLLVPIPLGPSLTILASTDPGLALLVDKAAEYREGKACKRHLIGDCCNCGVTASKNCRGPE